jgi:hypothetical protein
VHRRMFTITTITFPITATTINPTWHVVDHKTVETGVQTA